MEFTLEKLISDIKTERILWASETNVDSQEVQETWDKIAGRNKLTGAEAKSIFKVLCKKYKQEVLKPTSNWKLFNHLKFIDEADKPAAKKVKTEQVEPLDETSAPIEEETYVELLEVRDEDFSDDEYSRSFDDKTDLDESEEKPQKETVQEADIKPTTEVETKKASSPPKEEIKEKAPNLLLETNAEKKLKPVVHLNSILKRKFSDVKNEISIPEKRPALIPKFIHGKILQNGVVKQNAETETDAENQNSLLKKFSNFGQYVESTLNRLPPRLATKLEIKILQSIIEVRSEMMDKLE